MGQFLQGRNFGCFAFFHSRGFVWPNLIREILIFNCFWLIGSFTYTIETLFPALRKNAQNRLRNFFRGDSLRSAARDSKKFPRAGKVFLGCTRLNKPGKIEKFNISSGLTTQRLYFRKNMQNSWNFPPCKIWPICTYCMIHIFKIYVKWLDALRSVLTRCWLGSNCLLVVYIFF